MIKVLIVDDERLARNELKRLLATYPETEIVGEAANAEEAIRLAASCQPDLIFLDVQMPGRNGFEALETMESPPAVIFTTAYDHFAVRAFEVNALDYLLKPIEPERLTAALARFHEPDAVGDNPDQRLDENDRVFVKDGERCWFVKLGEVSLFESEGNYTRLFFGGERPLIYRSLSYLETRLDDKTFFRANRKHIVNLKRVDDLRPASHGGLSATLCDGLTVEMSRRQAQKFREASSL